MHAFFPVSDSAIWLYNESKFVISKLSFWLKLLPVYSRSNSSITDQCAFLWSICKYFIAASVVKLCFLLNRFTELTSGGSSPWLLPNGFSQPIQPQLLLHDLTAWRQGHFDLYSKHETTSFLHLELNGKACFCCLMVMTVTMRMSLFFSLHWYFCETQIETYFLNAKPKTYFFRKNNYLDIME